MVGFFYSTGIGQGIERDQAKALMYHTFAALGGNTRSEMTVAFRHHTGIATPRQCDEASFYYSRAALKAINHFRTGPPGGLNPQRHNFRLADDDGGLYGEGASYVSSGQNANRRTASTDTVAPLDDILEYLDLLSKKGDFSALFTLGKLHYEGSRRMPKNYVKAREYFLRIAKNMWDRDGRAMQQVSPEVAKWAPKAAGYIGRMYLRGEGVQQKFDRAKIWFQRGVTSNDMLCQHGLGLLYQNGYSVKQNLQKATDYFKMAADSDYPHAQVALGRIFLDQGDTGVSIRYFELAARHGHIEAYWYLALAHDRPLGGRERSCPLATAYYKLVAERVESLQSPMEWANNRYYAGDLESAKIGYMMAAEQGYEAAQANVAWLLDRAKSAVYIRDALIRFVTRHFFPASYRNASTTLASAAQRQLEAEQALIYFTRSAKQQNIDSLVKMGDYYISGIGLPASSTPTEASPSNASPTSSATASPLVGLASEPEKAAACYGAASEFQQSAQALWNLGWMHENGIGVEQDFHLAKRFYDQALATSKEAYLPVWLSLVKLRTRSAWNLISGGKVNGIGVDEDDIPPMSWKELVSTWWGASESDLHPAQAAALKRHGKQQDAQPAGQKQPATRADEDDDLGGTLPGGDGDQDTGFSGYWNDDGQWVAGEDDEDDLLETLVLLGMGILIMYLFYVRNRRQQQQPQAQGGAAPPAPPLAGGDGAAIGFGNFLGGGL